MQHCTLDQFRALSESGGVVGVTLRANGGSFYIEAETRRGGAVLVPQRGKNPRRFPDPRRALSLLREMGICEARIDARDWRPEQLGLEKASRPDSAAQLKAAHEALSHTDWLREKLAKSDADTRPRVPHEQVMSEAQAIIDRKRKAHAA